MPNEIVYLAGPMTGLPEFNYPAFAEAAARMRENGWTVLSPHENFNGDKTKEYREYIRADLAMLMQSTAIALLPGWEKSRGARFELHVAQMMGCSVYDATTMLPLDAKTVVTKLPDKEFGSVLVEAEHIVSGARQDAYGHPLDDFSKTAMMWSAIFGVPVTPEKVALGMIAVKMSRLLNTPNHKDSQVDIAGYIRTYEMVVTERKRREQNVSL